MDDCPARDQREHRPNTLDADFVDVYRGSDTTQALDVAFGIEPLVGLGLVGDNQATPFVHPHCVDRDPKDSCRGPNGVQGNVGMLFSGHDL
jgi:hypothetical protein